MTDTIATRRTPWIEQPRFWIVWNPAALRPGRQHETLEAAHREAKRLRAKYSAHQFLIFEARQAEEVDRREEAAQAPPVGRPLLKLRKSAGSGT